LYPEKTENLSKERPSFANIMRAFIVLNIGVSHIKTLTINNQMKSTRLLLLIGFLQDELAIPSASIDLAVRHHPDTPNLLPMILWQYGLITLKQLDRIFDWLETV
jgi:hypothetical protein